MDIGVDGAYIEYGVYVWVQGLWFWGLGVINPKPWGFLGLGSVDLGFSVLAASQNCASSSLRVGTLAPKSGSVPQKIVFGIQVTRKKQKIVFGIQVTRKKHVVGAGAEANAFRISTCWQRAFLLRLLFVCKVPSWDWPHLSVARVLSCAVSCVARGDF